MRAMIESPMPSAPPRLTPRDPEPEIAAITGTLGGISPRSVEEGLEPRMDELARCVESRRAPDLPLGGRVRLGFRIHLDGSVRWVHTRASTLDDRDAERCLLDVARQARFRRPGGGEAEFSWTLDLDEPGGDTTWQDAHRRPAVTRAARAASARCGEPEGVHVTVWIGPSGRVVRAGASGREPESEDALDCVASSVLRLRMPARGRLARVTFPLR